MTADRPTRNARRRRRRRGGNALVEAFLALPPLLFLSFGMVEFGQFLYVKHTINAASRDGARSAILSSATHAAAQQAVTNTMATANIPAAKYTVTFTDAASGATIADVGVTARGTGIKVTVSATAGNVTVRPLGVIPTAKAIVGITTMVKE